MKIGPRDRFGVFAIALALGLSAAAAACSSPTQPPSEPAEGDVTGTWTGSATDSSGDGRMTWQLIQTGDTFSGTITMTDTASSISGHGSISGTVSMSLLRFAISIPVGGFDSPFASCSTEVSGEAQATSSFITGTYLGVNSCTGAVTAGQVALSRAAK
jgi:hypothetical protein